MSQSGRALPHESAREHVRGEAVYLDDLPPLHGELFVGIVASSVAYGKLKSIDLEACRRSHGIVGVFTWRDVPGHNDCGPVFHDEEVLARESVHFVGHPIAAVAGINRESVEAAIKLATIDIEQIAPVLTIEESIEKKQFLGPTRRIARGDPAAVLTTAQHQLCGEVRIGGQEHFYLESQAAIAIPGEAGTVEIHSSTQNPTEIQTVVARCLGLPLSSVICTCLRMGGGFGGKETQAATPAMLAAIVATKTGCPARCVFGHEQDFRTTGKRHPYCGIL